MGRYLQWPSPNKQPQTKKYKVFNSLSLEPRPSLVVPPGLTDRPREVFRHLVEAFLASGEPVGSRTLSQRLPLALSPASIRNVMCDLESMGLLYAPHTSDGRVPTARRLKSASSVLPSLSRASRAWNQRSLTHYITRTSRRARAA